MEGRIVSDNRDKRRLRNVIPHLVELLQEANVNDLLNLKRRFPLIETYKTDGWLVTLGSLGRGQPRLEIWLDQFPNAGKRCFWFGFYAMNKRALKALIKRAPARLSPIRTMRHADFRLRNGTCALVPKLEQDEFNRPVYEEYYHRYCFFGMYQTTDSTSETAARLVAQRAARFMTDVLHQSAPPANDISPEGLPVRTKQTVHRFIRDTEMSQRIKRLYGFRCQVCGLRLEIAPREFYSEAHHLRPLGGEHKGTDVSGNVLCLCPNHHALFDYFAIPLKPSRLKLKRHKLGPSFVHYYNARNAST